MSPEIVIASSTLIFKRATHFQQNLFGPKDSPTSGAASPLPMDGASARGQGITPPSPRHSSRKIIRIGCLDGERRRKDDSTRSNSEDSKSTEKMRHLKSLLAVARSRLSHRLSHNGRYVGTFLLSGGETEVQREVRRNTGIYLVSYRIFFIRKARD
ncbi:hypothetical protein ACS0TY_008989 [Phlomoides rotata]